MLKNGLSASMMCVDFSNTYNDIKQLDKAKIEYMHFDIMDGEFVANYALGPSMIESLRGRTLMGFDIHLMVDHPEKKIEYFRFQEGDAVSVHIESTPHLQRVLSTLKQQGITTGVAINPSTKVEGLKYVLDVLDFVLIMTVNPGFAGQKLVPTTIQKISDTRNFLNKMGYNHIKIQVDGNVNFENAKKMKEAGADNFVCGTSGLFRKDMSIIEAAEQMRQSIA